MYAKTLAEQIDLPSTLINRFDIIHPLIDTPDKDKDRKLGNFIFGLDEGCENEIPKAPIETNVLRKYIAFARNLKPMFSKEAIKVCVDYYVKTRQLGDPESKMKPIPISPRQLEGVKRMAEAYAKIELSQKVQEHHAKRSTEMMDAWIKKIAFDSETQTTDFGRITQTTKFTDRDKFAYIESKIRELSGNKKLQVPIDEIVKIAATEKNLSENDVDEILSKLKRKGDVGETKRGFVQII